MLHGLTTNNSTISIILQKTCQQICRIHAAQCLQWHKIRNRPLGPLWKLGIIMWQPVNALPIRSRVGRSPPLKNLDQLIDVRSAGEEGKSSGHFGEDASDRPDVDGGRIEGCAEEKFGSAVPEGDDFVGVRAVGEAREAG